MGYYTTYNLDFDDEGATEAIRIWMMEDRSPDDPGDSGIWSYALDISGRPGAGNFSSNESCKWYDHDDDMTRLSLAFPHILFTLHGEGEWLDDIWRTFYRNGKHREVTVELVWPEIDVDREVPKP